MEEEGNKNWLIFVLLIGLIWALFFHKDTYEGQTAEEWFNAYDYEVSKKEVLRDALEQANYNIKEANSMIEDARGYTWESYEEMGDALDSLNTVDTIPEP